MKTSEKLDDLAAALSAFRADVVSIGKARDVEVKTDKGSYKFAYAPLPVIWEAIRAPLGRQTLSIVTATETADRQLTVTMRLLHGSGQWIESSLSCIAPDKWQAIGSAITYATRYQLNALLGLAADDDDDANAADGNVMLTRRDKAAPAKAPEPVAKRTPLNFPEAWEGAWAQLLKVYPALADKGAISEEGWGKVTAAAVEHGWKPGKVAEVVCARLGHEGWAEVYSRAGGRLVAIFSDFEAE